MIKIYSVLISLTLCSCFPTGHINYLGDSFPPTQRVDVYVDASAIRKAYTIIGKSSIDRTHFFSTDERIQQAAVEKAKEKGADAILFKDYTVIRGNTIQTVTKSDSVGSTSTAIRTTAISPTETIMWDILFLKYD